ncbi:hypothetical protein F511_26629 [Dorcoceras hygrometricum]|uniref:Uncharacterized protein n=1 Tax=Dorcoceras hygrometricum TaxID=472368 RepID=A0A2Z7CDU9_9LAMI|nr:hypothetical protein F511_26629 [Dorcoceras hygrometricum]
MKRHRFVEPAVERRIDKERSAGARRPAGELSNDDISSNVNNQQEATAQTSSWYWKLVYLIQTPLALIFTIVIWVYEIFRISGLLCVTNGLDPLEEQNLPNPLVKILRKLRRVQKLFAIRFLVESCEQLCEVIRGRFSRFRATSFSAKCKWAFCLTYISLAIIYIFRKFSSSSTVRAPLVQIGLSHSNSACTDFFTFVIWVYEIFRISGLLCVTNGLDPLEEQNLGTDQ